MVSAQAIGGLIGSLVIGRIGRKVRPGILIPNSGILFGLFDIALADLPGRAAITLVGAPVVGFSGGQTPLQTSVANDFRGRVFGAYATTVALMTLVGQGISSVLADRLGIVPVFTLAGTFEFLSGLVAFVPLRRAAHSTAQREPVPATVAGGSED